MLVKRDVFARQELHSERFYTEKFTCAWCGGVKVNRLRRHSQQRKYLYRFRIETDGGRKFRDTLVFCSVDCRRTHMGG